MKRVLSILFVFAAFAAAAGDLDVAKRALRDRLWSIAEKRASAAAENDPTSREEARLVVLEALAGAGRKDELLNRLDTWTDATSEGFRYWRAWALTELNCPNEARTLLAGTFTNKVYAVLVPRLAARLETAAAAHEAAERQFRLAAAACGTNAAARAANALEWARARDRFGQSSDALDVLNAENALSVSGPSGDAARLFAAKLRAKTGDASGARALLAKIVDAGEAVSETAFVQAACLQSEDLMRSGATNAALTAASNAVRRAVRNDLRCLAGYRLGFEELGDAATRTAGRARIRSLVRAFPDAPETRAAQLRLADTLLAAGDAVAAADEYRLYLEMYPSSSLDAHVLEGRGWALLKLERRAEAVGMFARAAQVTSDPDIRARCACKQADALLADGRFAEAALAYARVGEGPFRERARFSEADALVRAGDAAGARKRFLALMKEGGETAVAAALRVASAESAAGRMEDALTVYQALLDADAAAKKPKDRLTDAVRADVLLGRGRTYYRSYRFREAAADFVNVAGLKPASRDEMRFFAALCLYGEGKDAEARAAAAELLSTVTRPALRADLVLWLARYDFNHGDHVSAQSGFEASAANEPDAVKRAGTLVLAARCAAARSDYTKAIELVSRAVTGLPAAAKAPGSADMAYVDALILQGEALMELARFDEAVLVFERAAAAAPGSNAARRTMIMKADCLFAMGADNDARYRSALAAYRAVLRDEEVTPSVRLAVSFKIGRTLEKLRRFEEAMDQYYANVVNAYEDARQKGVWFDDAARGAFARAVFALADHYESRGEDAQAIRVLRLVLTSGVPAVEEARKRISRLKKKGGL